MTKRKFLEETKHKNARGVKFKLCGRVRVGGILEHDPSINRVTVSLCPLPPGWSFDAPLLRDPYNSNSSFVVIPCRSIVYVYKSDRYLDRRL